MDGVLVDSEPLDREAWAKVLGGYGIHVSEPELVRLTGKPAKAVLEYYRQQTGQLLSEEILAEKHEVFYKLAQIRLTPMPGVERFIRLLRERGILLAVASSSSHRRIQFSLAHTGLYPYFQAVCSGDDVQNPKPAPDVFLYAASKLNVHPASCTVIEDSIHGITASRRAGMDAYGYTSSFPAHALREAGAKFTFDSFETLVDRLEMN